MCSFYNMKSALINAVNVANTIAVDAKDKAGEISSKNSKVNFMQKQKVIPIKCRKLLVSLII